MELECGACAVADVPDRAAGGCAGGDSLRHCLSARATAQKERSPTVLRDHRCRRKGNREVTRVVLCDHRRRRRLICSGVSCMFGLSTYYRVLVLFGEGPIGILGQGRLPLPPSGPGLVTPRHPALCVPSPNSLRLVQRRPLCDAELCVAGELHVAEIRVASNLHATDIHVTSELHALLSSSTCQ